MNNHIQNFSIGFKELEELDSLTQAYLELSLPFRVAIRAAEADLCQHGGSVNEDAWNRHLLRSFWSLSI